MSKWQEEQEINQETLKLTSKRLDEEEQYLREKLKENCDIIRSKFEATSQHIDNEIEVQKILQQQKEKALDELKIQKSSKQPVEVSFGFIITE